MASRTDDSTGHRLYYEDVKSVLRTDIGDRISGRSVEKEMEASMAHLGTVDPEVAGILNKELRRQQNNIELIASENFVSEEVLEAQG